MQRTSRSQHDRAAVCSRYHKALRENNFAKNQRTSTCHRTFKTADQEANFRSVPACGLLRTWSCWRARPYQTVRQFPPVIFLNGCPQNHRKTKIPGAHEPLGSMEATAQSQSRVYRCSPIRIRRSTKANTCLGAGADSTSYGRTGSGPPRIVLPLNTAIFAYVILLVAAIR